MDDIYLRCACGAENISIYLHVEQEQEGSITFSSFWDQHRRWSERVRAAWTILRGREFVFAEIVLNPKEVQQLKGYLVSKILP